MTARYHCTVYAYDGMNVWIPQTTFPGDPETPITFDEEANARFTALGKAIAFLEGEREKYRTQPPKETGRERVGHEDSPTPAAGADNGGEHAGTGEGPKSRGGKKKGGSEEQ
jgi:hypothetical protein